MARRTQRKEREREKERGGRGSNGLVEGGNSRRKRGASRMGRNTDEEIGGFVEELSHGRKGSRTEEKEGNSGELALAARAGTWGTQEKRGLTDGRDHGHEEVWIGVAG
jgi:hypothetical protein